MSFLGGLMGGGGGDFNYTPEPTPRPPLRRDDGNEAWAKRFYHSKQGSTFKTISAHGSAAAPTKSYSAQLFQAGSGGV
jgi:hypothetical protein